MKKYAFRKKMMMALILLTLFSVVAACSVIVVGKFLKQKDTDRALTSEAFVFYADRLEGERYALLPTAAGNAEIPYCLFGSIGDVKNGFDTSYTVTVKKDGAAVAGATGVMAPAGCSGTVTVAGVTAGEVYEVVIASVSPFEKTLSFEIAIVDSAAVTAYSLTDRGSFVECTLYIGEAVPAAGITLAYPSLLPDSTNELLYGFTTESGQGTVPTSALSSNAQYTLIFFKSDQSKAYAAVDRAPITGNTVTID